jgi:hypothetical protein
MGAQTKIHFQRSTIGSIRMRRPYFQPKKSETGTDLAKPGPNSQKQKKSENLDELIKRACVQPNRAPIDHAYAYVQRENEGVNKIARIGKPMEERIETILSYSSSRLRFGEDSARVPVSLTILACRRG